MENADNALYQAKAKGKASCVMYDPASTEPEDKQDISPLQESDTDA
jgi:hypothetical protein